MGPAAAPFDPVRIIDAMLGVMDSSPPEKADQVADDVGRLIMDRDHPAPGEHRCTTVGALMDQACSRPAARARRATRRPSPLERSSTGEPPDTRPHPECGRGEQGQAIAEFGSVAPARIDPGGPGGSRRSQRMFEVSGEAPPS